MVTFGMRLVPKKMTFLSSKTRDAGLFLFALQLVLYLVRTILLEKASLLSFVSSFFSYRSFQWMAGYATQNHVFFMDPELDTWPATF